MGEAAAAQTRGFTLRDGQGAEHRYAPDAPALICFVKEDCPTCNLVMPVLDALWQGFRDRLQLIVVGQSVDGNRRLEARHAPGFALADDTDLAVSWSWGVETVPTLIWLDAGGVRQRTVEGFARDEWESLTADLARAFEQDPVPVAWAALPAWRPGCGSASADPLVAERLEAAAEHGPLRARRIQIGSHDDTHEFLFDQGLTDGLPVVPPTPERVLRMLAGTARDPQQVVAVVPPNLAEATVEKVAINAVMAGCRPEYLPVVLAALEGVCTDAFNAHGVMATTMGASPVMVVNGPIRERLRMNMKLGALGQGNRANATIGRALRLVLRNVGGARPGGTERSTLGNPMKFTMCFAEWEERNPWTPLHVERGFAPGDSVVTVFAMTSGPVQMVDQQSRTAAQLAGTFAQCLEAAFSPKQHFATNALVVVCPEHVDTLCRDGWGKAELRARIQDVTSRPVRELVEDEISGVGFRRSAAQSMTEDALDRRLPKFRRDEDIHITVAGAEAGKFSAAFHGWAIGDIGSEPVSVKIEETT